MDDTRNLVRLLRAADQRMSRATLSRESHDRIRTELTAAGRPGPRRLSTMVPAPAGVAALCGALCGAAALWLVLQLIGRPSEAPESTAVRATGFAWQGDGQRCSAAARAGSLTLDGQCHIQAEQHGISIASRGQAEIVRVEDGVRLARGTAEFEVAHRPRRDPVRVWVSAGAIEVTGTRFIVEQSREGGHVDLLEGSIRFRAKDGTVTQVRPGTRFNWADRGSAPSPGAPPAAVPSPPTAAAVDTRAADRDHAAPSPTTEPPPTPPARARSSGTSAARLIERVEVLRAQRRYQEAIDLLRQSRGQSWDPHTAEVLSVEEGDLLDRVGDSARACAHWRTHAKQFPAGSYREAVRTALSRPNCR